MSNNKVFFCNYLFSRIVLVLLESLKGSVSIICLRWVVEYVAHRAISSIVRKQPSHSSVFLFILHTLRQGVSIGVISFICIIEATFVHLYVLNFSLL